jgi:hypothetical protein
MKHSSSNPGLYASVLCVRKNKRTNPLHSSYFSNLKQRLGEHREYWEGRAPFIRKRSAEVSER